MIKIRLNILTLLKLITSLLDGKTEYKKDFNALNGAAPLTYSNNPYSEDDGVWLLIIEIERINGVPHYRYLGNHNRQDIPFEPWSSAKLVSCISRFIKSKTNVRLDVLVVTLLFLVKTLVTS